ncbi:hypothetical protein C8Q75DRAFT_41766 [Abortiporus biennis]|nr:hypothetical protein C8Q75DRAFT_41766 [Abortiporus biennis]
MDSPKRPVNGLANSGMQSPSTLNVPLSRLSRGFSIRSLDSIPSAQLSSISERITHPESSTSPRITEPPPVVDNSFPHVSFLAAEGSEDTTKPPHEPQPSIPAVVSPEYTTESNATKLADALKKHDEDRVNHCKEDIDTLLVFAGLFSAVLSAFVVDSYKMLQDDPANVSAQILATISQQLVTISQGSSQPVTSPPAIPVFKAPIVSVRVNALWFTALVFSLVTASLAIFVKQWLREYLSLGCTSPEERLRVRHVRYKGLIRWRVFEIAAILPFLLQISLLLFFVGLSQFLWPLNIAVWAATTAFIIIWAILYLITVFAPAFSSTCPYKTPVLSPILHYARQIFAQLRHGPSWKRGYNQMLAYYRFPGDERGIRRDEKFDIPALISADEALADDGQLVDIIKPCILNARGSEVIYVAREILSHRLDCNIEHLGLSFKEGLELSKIPARVLNVVVDSLCNAVLYSGYSPMTPMDVIEALEGLWTLADHIYFARRAVDLQFLIRTLSATPMYPNYLRIVLSITSAHWFPLRMTWDNVPEPAITS